MIKFAIVFQSAPFGNASSREGLDLLLAATAFCAEDEIAVFFINEGVLNLLPDQQPELILQKDFISAFKLLELYEIEQCYISQQALQQFDLKAENLIIPVQALDNLSLFQKIKESEKLFVF